MTQNTRIIEHSKNIRILRILEKRLDLECSSPASNKHRPARVLENKDRIEAQLMAYDVCFWHPFCGRVC